MRRNCGFALAVIYVLIVVAVIGLVFAIATPNW